MTRLIRTVFRRAGTWWAGVSIVAVAGFALAAAGLLGFVAIADEVLEGETQRVDEAVLGWLAGSRAEWLDTVALQVTALGNAATTDVLAGWLAGVAWTGLLVAVFRLLGAFTGEVPEPVPPAAQSRSANSLEE